LARPTRQLANPIDIRRAIKQRVSGMSYADIATSQGVSRQAVQQALKPIMDMIGDPEQLKAYQENRADVMDGLQKTLARSMLDRGKLKAASINNLAYAMRQLNDMGRLERDQSTANVAVQHSEVSKTMEEVDAEIARITEELPQGADNTSPDEKYKDDPKLKRIDEEMERLAAQGIDMDDDIVDGELTGDG
jgi:predicted DNA-binding protein YlxM (UPF0122 family)